MKIAQLIINEITPESSALLIFRGALKYQANQTLELSDEELEDVAGGFLTVTYIICAGTLAVVPFL